jgi:hypothetical protein
MLSSTRLTFYDEFYVFLALFFLLILADFKFLDPYPRSQSNADPDPEHGEKEMKI